MPGRAVPLYEGSSCLKITQIMGFQNKLTQFSLFLHLALDRLALPITMPGKVYNSASSQRPPHNIFNWFFSEYSKVLVQIFSTCLIFWWYSIYLSKTANYQQALSFQWTSLQIFFPPHARRSHEADTEEQKASRDQIRFKGSDFQIKKYHQKKKKFRSIFQI